MAVYVGIVSVLVSVIKHFKLCKLQNISHISQFHVGCRYILKFLNKEKIEH